jgi:ribose/xylose/arabinose/galactoside ABC-type transport system permease subunit
MTTTIDRPTLLGRGLAAVAPLLGLLALLVVAAVTTPDFYRASVLQLVLFQVGLIGVTAVGQTFVLLAGGIDLSIGAVVGLTTVIVASWSDGANSKLLAAVVLAAAAGLLVGALNAALVVLRNVPPFVATFAGFVLVAGVIVAWTQGAPSGSIPGDLQWWGAGKLLGIPVPTWIFAVAAGASAVVLGRTTIGRRIYATGLNPRATALSGIRTSRVTAGCYLASSLLAVVGGLISAGYIGYVDAQVSRTLDLNSIAAAVIGGVALTGGRGRMGQTVVGVLLLAVLLTWLVQLGAGPGAQLIVSGAVILGAVSLQNNTLNIKHATSTSRKGKS